MFQFSITFEPSDMTTGPSQGRSKQKIGYDTKLQIPGQEKGTGDLR